VTVSTVQDLLTLDIAGGVATIRLQRTSARNALDMALKGELAAAIEQAAERDDVRAVLLTGAGDAFCAGGDIVEMALNDNPVRSRARLRRLLDTIFVPLTEMEKPTVAAVNGHAHGAGLSLALACDLVIAAEDAHLSCAFSKVGLIPDCGALYFLSWRLPAHVVKDLVFTGRRLSAAEGAELGLINRVVPREQLDDVTETLARQLAAGPTVAYGMTKTLLARAHHLGLHDLSEFEAFGQAIAYATEDHLIARQAFSQKSIPSFVGR